jgi:hypothetical protein
MNNDLSNKMWINIPSEYHKPICTRITAYENGAYISSFTNIFYNHRNGILCWYSTQNGYSYVFIVYYNGTNVKINNILNAENVTCRINGDMLYFGGMADWGNGLAIGCKA